MYYGNQYLITIRRWFYSWLLICWHCILKKYLKYFVVNKTRYVCENGQKWPLDTNWGMNNLLEIHAKGFFGRKIKLLADVASLSRKGNFFSKMVQNFFTLTYLSLLYASLILCYKLFHSIFISNRNVRKRYFWHKKMWTKTGKLVWMTTFENTYNDHYVFLGPILSWWYYEKLPQNINHR